MHYADENDSRDCIDILLEADFPLWTENKVIQMIQILLVFEASL
jgi:hypothetical protein